ncbi:glycoside hydrolase family 36 protein [Streptomyces sp. NPDC005811]|uniref:glycoside hydrolase family 36 protein n=1 Tax=Streptomyces sp. NPDC005811 TaxID=3154565 RepID=UPI0033C4498A
MTITHLCWGTAELSLLLALDTAGPARLLAAGEAASLPDPDREPERCAALARRALPLVEMQTTDGGRLGTSGKRHVDGALSRALRCTGHEGENASGLRTLRIRMADDTTGLRVTAEYRLRDGIPVLHAEVRVENTGDTPVTLEYVSSFALSNLARTLPPGRHWEDGLALWLAANPWSGEFRWSRATLAERGLVDVGMVAYGQTGSKNRIAVTSTGSWSSSEHLPMGCLEEPDSGRALAWQIEHNGSWHAELADRFDDLYLTLSGPTDREHQWHRRLAPQETFLTVPVAVALVPSGGFPAAVAALTGHRRATRRPHPDLDGLPVVFNDFMNSLMGEPSTEALLPLVDAAARAGAEVFCVDAGWFDPEPPGTAGPGGVPGWWDAVGEWRESATRFPGGLGEVMDRIRDAGMVPGLWLEPEVVGVRSPVAAALPDEAFFRRNGVRVVEWGRHQLDLRHPAARAHLDTVVDRLVRDHGVGYLKLDYNIDIGAGTDGVPPTTATGAGTRDRAGTGDAGGHGPGDGLLGHNRAYLDWLDGVLDRHPGLTLESCAAGGSRTDHAILSRLPIHSVTDQQDFRLLPAIAAAAPTAVTPEQGAIWAYPQPEHSAADLSTVLVSALLGRVHLSGRPDLLSDEQHARVREAVDTYKGYRHLLPTARPHWPLGLPGWREGRPALALAATDGTTLLALWRRTGAPATVTVPLPWTGPDDRPRVLFEAQGEPGEGVALDWDPPTRTLRAVLPAEGSAALIVLEPPARD